MVYIDRAETTPLGPGEQSFDANNDVTSNIKRFNFGITGGIGFTEEIGFGELFLDVRGAYGLTNVQKYSKDGKSHNGYVLIALGYSIGL